MSEAEAKNYRDQQKHFEEIIKVRSYIDQAYHVNLPKVPSFDSYFDMMEMNLIMVELEEAKK
jgi:hypothetical protein